MRHVSMARAIGGTLLIIGLTAVAVTALGVTQLFGDTLGEFEIDADHDVAAQALYAQTSDDWAETGTSTGDGVFVAGTGGDPDFLDCYESDISVNPAIDGTATFLCDGLSDSSFDGSGPDIVTQPEQNIVSPGGKQISDIWAVQPGSVTGKDDFSHAYSLFRFSDSGCDADTDADDRFLVLAGHRGDNEGDAFWGFELSQTAPSGFAQLEGDTGASFDLDFNRTVGDLLISFTLVGGGSTPVLEVFRWDGSTYVLTSGSCPLDPPGPQGSGLLQTNDQDIQAPPWNVPVCDPTATNGSNSCRIVNKDGTSPAGDGDNLIAALDFNEAIVDLGAFVTSEVCFESLIFTSRSAHPLETADLKDVGGVTVDTCVSPSVTPTPTPTATPTSPAPAPTPTPTPSPTATPTPQPPTSLPPTGATPQTNFLPWWLVVYLGITIAVSGTMVLVKTRSR